MATTLTAMGLTLNIVGTLLIWRFGLPEAVSRKGEDFLITSHRDPSQIKKAKQYDRFSALGAFLLVVGFLLQLIGILV